MKELCDQSNGVPLLQMRSVGPHSTSGREKGMGRGVSVQTITPSRLSRAEQVLSSVGFSSDSFQLCYVGGMMV